VYADFESVVNDHSQFEHVKTIQDKISDIFEHTDHKVEEVMKNLIRVYN
jgi:hypothetical protein